MMQSEEEKIQRKNNKAKPEDGSAPSRSTISLFLIITVLARNVGGCGFDR